MIKKLFSHTFIYALGPQIPKIITIVTLPLVTKKLSVEDFGIYGILMAYIGAIQVIKDLGFSLLFYNTYYTRINTYPLLWRNFMGILSIWSIPYSLITGVVTYAVLHKYDPTRVWVGTFLVVLPALFFENIIAIGTAYFRCKESPMAIAANVAFSGIVSAVLSVYLIVIHNMGYMGWVIATLIGSLLSFSHYAYILFKKVRLYPIFKMNKGVLARYFKIGLPMIPHNYSGYLLNASDRVVMEVVAVEIRDIGRYNIAYIFGNYFSVFENFLSYAANPFYLKYIAKDQNRKVKYLTFLLQLIFLNATVITCLWINEIFSILIKNKDYSNISALAILIIMGYNYKPMYMAANIRLSIKGDTMKLLKVSFIGGVLNVVLNIVLIPFFGIIASAAVTFVALLYLGFAGFYLNGYQKTKTVEYHPLRWLFFIVLLTTSLLFLANSHLFIKILVTLLIAVADFFIYFKYKPILKKLD